MYYDACLGVGLWDEPSITKKRNCALPLTNYFINSDYSFQELVYAVATHPVFMAAERSDGTVTDPLEDRRWEKFPPGAERMY